MRSVTERHAGQGTEIRHCTFGDCEKHSLAMLFVVLQGDVLCHEDGRFLDMSRQALETGLRRDLFS